MYVSFSCTYLGDAGYLSLNKSIMEAATKIRRGMETRVPELEICGNPSMSVIAFRSRNASTLNIFKIGEAMSKRHWNLNTLQKPSSLHICVTYMHVNVTDTFVNDLAWAVSDVTTNPDNYKNGSAAIYGMAESLPDASLADDMAKGFLDCLYKA